MSAVTFFQTNGDGSDTDCFSPEITVSENIDNVYKLNIKTATDEFETPNLIGKDGKDAYTVCLSLDSWNIPASTDAAIASSASVNVIAFKGGTQVNATIGTITGQVTGLGTSISNNNTISANFTVSATTSLTTRSGVLTIPVTVDGKSFTKKFSWALVLTGVQGIPGTSLNVELIFSGDANTEGTTYTTTKLITNFKYLIIKMDFNNEHYGCVYSWIPVEDISLNLNANIYICHMYIGTDAERVDVNMHFTANNKFALSAGNYIGNRWERVGITKIWGVY